MTNMPGRLSVHAFYTRCIGLPLAGVAFCLSLLLPQATMATSGGATITVWATNGTTTIVSSAAASKVNGTDFGACVPGNAYTNTLYVSNDGDGTPLTISSWTTNGPGFTFTGIPSSVLYGAKTPFKVIYLPPASGSNSVSLVINNSASGAYTVKLAGSGPVATTPVITAQPVSAVVAVDQLASLSVSNSGTGPFVYKWIKDGVILSGQTNSTLSISSFKFTDSGSYSVVITNSVGMSISLPASLSVPNAPLRAWGSNGSGQLGNGTTGGPTNRPALVANNVVAVAGGWSHSLFVQADGTLWAMGYNGSGQLGNGTTGGSTNRPVQVADNVLAVAGGFSHSLFVKADGTLWAMGANGSGQLGNGTTADTNQPVQVASNVVTAAAGYSHSLFVKADGTLWAMGANDYGQLGNGTTGGSTNRPVQVASNVAAAAGGNAFSQFVKADGTLWAMGENNSGQLGNGTTGGSTNRPVQVASNVVAAGGGYSHSLFVKADRTLWAVGNNTKGQLGNGATGDPTNRPIQVASNVAAVAGGQNNSLFVKADGTLWGMGNNIDGQLGNGTMTDTNRPVQVSGNLLAAVMAKAPTACHSLAIAVALPAVSVSNRTVTFGQSTNFMAAVTGDSPFTYQWQKNGTNVVSATNVTYTISGAALSDAGSYAVMVASPYGSATSLVATLTVSKADQTITFPDIGDQLTTNHVGLVATATSGLSVTFTTNGGPAIITGGTNLTFSGTGIVSIVASQAGDTDWNAAPNVTNTFEVTPVVNHAPVGTSNTVTTVEDTPYTFATADFGFTDPNDAPANALAAVMITTVPGTGTLRSGGSVVTNGQRIAVAS
ncbi:MAG: immunoglobulin domain-containing protein [bacterium]